VKGELMKNEAAIKLREQIFEECFEEFAFLTLRKYDPELLAHICESLTGTDQFSLVHVDARRIHLALSTAAIKYVVCGEAEKFYTEGKSGIVSKLTVCSLCQNGEHERCYVDADRFWHCSCPCSKVGFEAPAPCPQMSPLRARAMRALQLFRRRKGEEANEQV
jgi:hypothetical protein